MAIAHTYVSECVCLAILFFVFLCFFRNRLLSQFCQFYVNLLSCQKGRRDNKLSEKSIKSRVGRRCMESPLCGLCCCCFFSLPLSHAGNQFYCSQKKRNKNKEKKKHFHWSEPTRHKNFPLHLALSLPRAACASPALSLSAAAKNSFKLGTQLPALSLSLS